MDDLIAQLRSTGVPLNPPAAPDALGTLEAVLGFTAEPDLRALYQDHDGMRDLGSLPMRLMSTAEAVAIGSTLRENDLPAQALRFLWTDDDAGYGALYVEGPLRGTVALEQRHSTELAPRFRSLRSFYAAMLRATEAEQDWYEVPTDYPPLASGDPALDAAERALALELVAEAAAEPDEYRRQSLLLCALDLLPAADIEPILTLARDEDMYVQERACELLGLRRVALAVPLLAEVVRTGMPNGSMAALRALGQIGGPEVAALLLQVARERGPRYDGHIADALRECGYETRFDRGETGLRALLPGARQSAWHYRAAPGEPWSKL